MINQSYPHDYLPTPSNDLDGEEGSDPMDPRILRIAAAIGRQLAREWLASQRGANRRHDDEEHPLEDDER